MAYFFLMAAVVYVLLHPLNAVSWTWAQHNVHVNSVIQWDTLFGLLVL